MTELLHVLAAIGITVAALIGIYLVFFTDFLFFVMAAAIVIGVPVCIFMAALHAV